MKENDTSEALIQYHNSLRACRALIRTKTNYEKQIAHEID